MERRNEKGLSPFVCSYHSSLCLEQLSWSSPAIRPHPTSSGELFSSLGKFSFLPFLPYLFFILLRLETDVPGSCFILNRGKLGDTGNLRAPSVPQGISIPDLQTQSSLDEKLQRSVSQPLQTGPTASSQWRDDSKPRFALVRWPCEVVCTYWRYYKFCSPFSRKIVSFSLWN